MKNIYFLSIVFFVTCSALAQHLVEYDFKKKTPPKVPVAELGQNSVFMIKNINKFLYEVKIVSSQSEFNSEPPEVFSTIFQIEKANESSIQEEAQQVIDNAADETDTKKSAITLGIQKSSLLWNELMLASFNEDVKELSTLPDALKDEARIEELNIIIESLNEEIETQQEVIKQLRETIGDEFLKRTTELYVLANNVNEAFIKLEESKTIKNKLIQLSLTDGLNYNEAITSLGVIKKEYPFVLKTEKLLEAYNKTYRKFKTEEKLYIINQSVLSHFNNDLGKIKSSINNLSQEIENTQKKVGEYKYNELFQGISKLYNELKNKNNYFIASDPVQAKKDVINYSISINPRKDIGSLTAMETRNFSTEVPIKGGVKIDFSTGLTVASGLHDRTYAISISSTDSTKSTITENDNNNVGTLSLAALMHVSKRTSESFKPGFALGLGLNSTELKNAQIYLGASGMFGTRERFIVTIGASMANVDYIKPGLSLNEEISNKLLNDGVTEETRRVGFFIGFSYNLTNKKKD